MPYGDCRQLNVMGAAVDLSFLRNKKLRDLMHSKPSSSSQYRVLQRLETRNVVAMAKFSALRRLELASWLEWDDLRPLAALQLQVKPWSLFQMFTRSFHMHRGKNGCTCIDRMLHGCISPICIFQDSLIRIK